MSRCPRCFRRVEPDFADIHICASTTPAPLRPPASSERRRYWRPSRPRTPRQDYLASVSVSDEQKREQARARQAAYRARKKASVRAQ